MNLNWLLWCVADLISTCPTLTVCHHHADELDVINGVITVDISLSHHLLSLLLRKANTEDLVEDVLQLIRSDVARAIKIEFLEGLD